MKVVLRKRLEKVLSCGHPWIFRDALEGKLSDPGQVVTVVDRQGKFIARGLSEGGPIGVRVFCTRDEPLDKDLFVRRIRDCADLRKRVVPQETNAYRLVHGEGDRLPGVVCDVYNDHAVVQFDGKASLVWQPQVVEALHPVLCGLGVKNLLMKSGKKGDRRVDALIGRLPAGPVSIIEHGMLQKADLITGQKTGLFLDHRESRFRVYGLAKGLRVLNLYGYTGGFSVAAGLGGAVSTDTVDRSASACKLAEENWVDNGLSSSIHGCYPVAVDEFLKSVRDRRQTYDLVIADPPSFAPSEAKLASASKAYQALHRSVIECLKPNGLYLAASCSSHVTRETFEKVLLEAARRAGKILQVLDRWGAPADHPRLASFPEGDYLKVVLARMIC